MRGDRRQRGKRGTASPIETQHPEVRAARVNGRFLIVGAVIASLVGVSGTAFLQHQQNAREDRLEKQERRKERRAENLSVRGAARMLYLDLTEAAMTMTILGNDRFLRRFDPSYDVELRPESLELIAARVSGEQWGSVVAGLSNVQQLKSFVNTLIERGRHRLTRGEVCYVRHDLRSVLLATHAIAEVLDPVSVPPAPRLLRCQPRPGPIPASVPRGP